MKIVAFNGSPNKDGFTTKLLEAVTGTILQTAPDTSLCTYRPGLESNLSGCIGCKACRSNRELLGCIHNDAVTQWMDEVIGADAILFAAPVYMWALPAQFKIFVDRFYSLIKKHRTPRSLVTDKRFGLLLSMEGDRQENAHAIGSVQKFARYFGMEYCGEILLEWENLDYLTSQEGKRDIRAFIGRLLAGQLPT